MQRTSGMRAILPMLTVLLVSSAAAAANLMNKDPKKYAIEITCDGAKTKSAIGPNTMQEGGIEKDCLVQLGPSGPKLRASGRDVIIERGKLRESASEASPGERTP